MSTYVSKKTNKPALVILCNGNVREGHFDGLNSFADLLFEKLSCEVDKEIVSEQIDADTWYFQEEQNAEYLHKKNTYQRVKRLAFQEALDILSQRGQVLLSVWKEQGRPFYCLSYTSILATILLSSV